MKPITSCYPYRYCSLQNKYETTLFMLSITTMLRKETKMNTNEIIKVLYYNQRKRRFFIKKINAERNTIMAFIAQNLEYNSYQDEKERKQKFEQARQIFKTPTIETITKFVSEKDKATAILQQTIEAIEITNTVIQGLQDNRKTIEKMMEYNAEQLPIAKWWTKERGRGLLGLAILIGESGDISNYENPAKLWKRFGVAVIDGTAQGNLDNKTTSKELWIEHGYNRMRRSALWTIGDCLIKTNGNDGRYRACYLERKEFELKRLKKEWIKKGKDPKKFKPLHAHRRAQRYMEKLLLRDLWNKWHGKSETQVKKLCKERAA